MLGDRFLAEEAVEEAFVAAWRHIGSYDEARAPFAAWLTHIAHNKTVDLLRRRRRAQAASTDQAEADVVLRVIPDPAPGPDERAEAHWLGEQVRRALAALPVAQREIIVLAYFRGRTHEEIARDTGRPLGTVKTWIRTGLEALRAALERDAVRETP